MRAGSLSDPRIIAMLRKHFVCVEMTELVTKDLIEDPRDVALLEKYDRQLRQLPLHRRASLDGGEREVFITPDGELVRVILSLHCGNPEGTMRLGYKMVGQFSCADRAKPDMAVERFFDVARETLEKSRIDIPRDWAALRAGTHPMVARVRDEAVPQPVRRDQDVLLQAWVRADVIYYESLVGRSLIPLSRDAARDLIAQDLVKGAIQTCNRRLFETLFSSCYPKGAGVLVDLEPDSIQGALQSEVTRVDGNHVQGRLRGTLRLAPKTQRERSRRKSYSPWRESRCELVGDFCYDRKARQFTRLRIVSKRGVSSFAHGRSPKTQAYALGLELVKRPPKRRRRKL